MQLIERRLNSKDHGVAGFLVHPQRTEPGRPCCSSTRRVG